MSLSKIFMIGGPCSAESYEQLRLSAQFIASQGIPWLRAGLWKPRSRPEAFEGVGLKGLDWLSKVGKEFSLKTMTEVYRAEQVEKLIASGISGFWLGARTTTNPFIVEEISLAAENTDLDIFVKNPLAPDLKLWVGAVERVLKRVDAKNVHLVHRGFSTYSSSGFRNDPIWDLALEMKRVFPDLKMICDPSHLAGSISAIPTVSYQALMLGFSGLMLEVHPNPSQAFSDADQQLDFKQTEKLLQTLSRNLFDSKNERGDFSKISDFRNYLSAIDSEIFELIVKRKEVVKKIGERKKEFGLSTFDSDQFSKLLKAWKEKAEEVNFDQVEAERIYRLLHSFSLEWQLEFFNSDR